MSDTTAADSSQDLPAVRLRGLGKRFARRRSWDQVVRDPFRVEYVTALEEVTLDIAQGEFFGLLGPNGAGKTTLFKILSTLVTADTGVAEVFGHRVSETSRVRALLAPVIADERSLLWRLSAAENLLLFARLQGLRGSDARQRVEEMLSLVDLTTTGIELVGTFSSGMKQRLLIARCLLAQPRVILLDEPTRSLDPITARDFRRFLRRDLVDRRGCTVLLATHSADEAFELCDRVGVLDQGRIRAAGTIEELGDRVADGGFLIVAEPSLQSALERLAERGAVRLLSTQPTAEEGWNEFTVQIPGGRSAAAAVLEALGRSGLAIAHFERRPLTLAHLLEQIVKGSRDA